MQRLPKRRKIYLVLGSILIFSLFVHQIFLKNDLRVWKLESSATCMIPEIDPFSKSALLMIEIHGKIDGSPPCIGQEVKFFIDYNSSSLGRKDTQSAYWKSVTCCYTTFRTEKVGKESSVINGPECYPVTGEFTGLPHEHQNLDIKCRAISTNDIVYRDQLTIFRLNNTLEQEVEDLHKTLNKNVAEQLSILVIGLDSVSHMGLIRHMPKTHRFLLQNLSGIEYFGFNKVGSGTIQNVIAMTTGCPVDHFEDPPWSLDPACELIWTRFAEQGYRTVLYEDTGFLEFDLFPALALLNGSTGTGTHYKSTDFTVGLRHIDKTEMGSTVPDGFGCFDNQYLYDTFVEEALEIGRTFRNKPFFQFLWLAKTAHQVMRNTQFMDEPSYKLLLGLQNQTLLNTTILFVLSDHGPWHGAYLNTDAGTIERLMPPFYAVFPDWFKSKYSDAIQNYNLNARRLTTQFDLHETLLDLLDLTQVENRALEARRRRAGSLGQSLFLPVPLDRTCESANIPYEYCVCWLRTNVPDPQKDPDVIKAVQFILNDMKSDLEGFPLCSHLELESIVQARKLESRIHEEQNNWILQVVFTTLPAHAEFHGTVSMDTTEIKLLGNPLRNTVYGDESSCIAGWANATYAKTICYCR